MIRGVFIFMTQQLNVGGKKQGKMEEKYLFNS